MHFHCEVCFKEKPEDVNQAIEEAMAPYCEETSSEGWWDWWQIGGRWTGAHTPGYDPENDPANVETCNICEGTGFRDDDVAKELRGNDPEFKCNGCRGTGEMAKWPTQWKPYDGDVMAVEKVPDTLNCYTLLVEVPCPEAGPDFTRLRVFHKEQWTGQAWEKTGFDGKVKPALAALGITTGFLVTVDYHC